MQIKERRDIEEDAPVMRRKWNPPLASCSQWVWALLLFSFVPLTIAAERGAKPIRALIVTGIDYPGHHWRETTPVLREELGKDSRMSVQVLEDPYQLGTADLSKQDVLLLHFMNWEKPDPDDRAKENLRTFVERGGGLVIIHFACGAFQGWPEYAALAGRIYDRVNTHDPRGPFTVDIVEGRHPLTRGMRSFETDDELYICLTGDKPVELLATARSKVTQRDHPMALVHAYGKGRVFLTPLGHDTRALRMPGAAELIRRGTAWAAGRDIAATNEGKKP
jgi:type 1 glutamine amidotransferase